MRQKFNYKPRSCKQHNTDYRTRIYTDIRETPESKTITIWYTPTKVKIVKQLKIQF